MMSHHGGDIDVIIIDVYTVNSEPRWQCKPMHCIVEARPMIGDPSMHCKGLFQKVLENAFTDLKIQDFPLFEGHPLKITVIFGMTDMDKDIYSLLKFIMDMYFR
jgi:hypothetical protein